MTKRTAEHATFVIDRVFAAAPGRVFNAFADEKAKARWFGGPKEWDQGERSMDFRVGGREVNRGGPAGGPQHSFEALYWDIVPNERIVYSYEMHLDDRKISVSLATIEMKPEGSGTRLVVTEQGVFLDGYDDNSSREHGTRQLIETLGRSLEEDGGDDQHAVVLHRIVDLPPAELFKAWSDPERLKNWWGPNGFTNTFHEYDLRPGGAWRFVMHGPDGQNYPNESVFVDVDEPKRIVFDHLNGHIFRMTFALTDLGGQTDLEMRMSFPTKEDCDAIRAFVTEKNGEVLDRLEAEMASAG
ncbi:SRPBCC family protein [Kaistia dalseonensis]|uniref:Uncharacterized protein YndB with AHSA1/START domain n=1 Tax=Kaistia dalseonensis TaxID=410840 RepID=A0ABU0H884_9HYPH|nr:SRPBCC family protein [Kaistia dalseonensis]MCX5495926.1 SRPBCC family protein [Kaistia dalseonensis]MDQ0438529.1 uncharacterized protein YndB with AHSA1/START domain [Kaistia dalseonensis]